MSLFLKYLVVMICNFLMDKGIAFREDKDKPIALTRAIVHKPSHFILDEPTSAMDMNAENLFINNFKNLKDSTMIIVSHRMPLVKSCRSNHRNE